MNSLLIQLHYFLYDMHQNKNHFDIVAYFLLFFLHKHLFLLHFQYSLHFLIDNKHCNIYQVFLDYNFEFETHI